MKRVLLVCLLVLGLGAMHAGAVDVPNLEASLLYDFTTKEVVPGLTSKIVSIGDVDVRIGYTSANTGIASLSYDLMNLEKFGSKVHYLWGESVRTSLGTWIGYNLKTELLSYGLLGVVIEVKF